MSSELSGLLKSLILRGGSSYTVAGLWAGGVIAVLHPSDKAPAVFFQANDLEGYSNSLVPITQGLEIRDHVLSISGQNQTGLLLQPSDSEDFDPYFSLVDFLFEKLSFERNLTPSWRIILDIIQDWMEFWKAKGKQPIRESILGLIGELVTITDLLRDDENLSFENWQGPLGGNHDFQFKNRALEVKVCGNRAGGLIHKISSQRQLEEPEGGELFIHSLRIQLGPNFTSSINDLIGRAESSRPFSSPEGTTFFRDCLSMILKPSEIPKELSTYLILESHLLKVDQDFPRLLNSELRRGVIDVKYSIDLTSLTSELTRSDERSFVLSSGRWFDDI